MKKIICILSVVLVTHTACDLQPKILSLPDSVGEFISARYPALLADPNTHPEIYNSAATDYGLYASPELYGNEISDDYVIYASVDDYVIPQQSVDADTGTELLYGQYQQELSDDILVVPEYTKAKIMSDDLHVVVKGDTLYSLAKKYDVSVDELARLNNLSEPYQLSVGQKLNVNVNLPEYKDDVLTVRKPQVSSHTVMRVDLQEIKIAPGDTLYSLSRKYSVPVNDLAVMNNIKPPFNLSVGQVLRVPDLKDKQMSVKTVANTDSKSVESVKEKSVPVKKISSDPSKKLPKITARSSSVFSWPLRGRILSDYGAKPNGLFNDGINIAAAKGSAVKAAENGVVAYAGNEVKGMGNLIIIQHDAGWMTVYAHMDSMNVKRGAKVAVGQQIGVVGETGKVDTPQLHFEIRKGTKAYNPSSYLKK